MSQEESRYVRLSADKDRLSQQLKAVQRQLRLRTNERNDLTADLEDANTQLQAARSKLAQKSEELRKLRQGTSSASKRHKRKPQGLGTAVDHALAVWKGSRKPTSTQLKSGVTALAFLLLSANQGKVKRDHLHVVLAKTQESDERFYYAKALAKSVNERNKGILAEVSVRKENIGAISRVIAEKMEHVKRALCKMIPSPSSKAYIGKAGQFKHFVEWILSLSKHYGCSDAVHDLNVATYLLALYRASIRLQNNNASFTQQRLYQAAKDIMVELGSDGKLLENLVVVTGCFTREELEDKGNVHEALMDLVADGITHSETSDYLSTASKHKQKKATRRRRNSSCSSDNDDIGAQELHDDAYVADSHGATDDYYDNGYGNGYDSGDGNGYGNGYDSGDDNGYGNDDGSGDDNDDDNDDDGNKYDSEDVDANAAKRTSKCASSATGLFLEESPTPKHVKHATPLEEDDEEELLSQELPTPIRQPTPSSALSVNRQTHKLLSNGRLVRK
eukprot:m.116441 g.116441  ORF g.116441 m.116441 type:complete len:504 (-) comp15518_c0_seq5:114-1625(-)